MRIDYEALCFERLVQVAKDIRKATQRRDWDTKYELVREKIELEDKLRKYRINKMV